MSRTELLKFLEFIEFETDISTPVWKEIDSKLDEIETLIRIELEKADDSI